MNIVFNASAGPSLGIEVELEIVDRGSRQLFSAATDILAELGAGYPGGEHPKVKHELFECTAEVITGICATVAQARDDLTKSINELAKLTDARGLALMCSGSHPFSDWHDQQVSPHERYRVLVDEMQWVARRLQIFGVHFHVGVRSAAKAIAIGNALNTYIPHFLALSASSPFWGGRDTGMASSRSTVFEGLPTAGLPYQLSGWEEFEEFMGTLVAAQAITSIREVWWDIRPHPDFGTIELRICDGIPTLTEVGALAAMAQSLVHWLDTRIDAGEVPAVPRGWVVRQNKWRAARHGLDAEIITDDDGRRLPLRRAVEELVETLSPAAAQLGCTDELGLNLATLADGASYERQRGIVARGGSLVDVVDALVAEFEADCAPGRR